MSGRGGYLDLLLLVSRKAHRVVPGVTL